MEDESITVSAFYEKSMCASPFSATEGKAEVHK